jgi:hypothetical protein
MILTKARKSNKTAELQCCVTRSVTKMRREVTLSDCLQDRITCHPLNQRIGKHGLKLAFESLASGQATTASLVMATSDRNGDSPFGLLLRVETKP